MLLSHPIDREMCQLSTVFQLEFGFDIRAVRVDGPGTHSKSSSNLIHRHSPADHLENL